MSVARITEMQNRLYKYGSFHNAVPLLKVDGWETVNKFGAGTATTTPPPAFG